MKQIDDRKLQLLESKIQAYKIRDKDSDQRKTYDEVFDERTLLTLYNLMSNNVIDILDFPLATGKEGNVFRANTRDGKYVAVKIYRVNNSTFKHLQKYIVGDKRFRSVGKNHRRAIITWAQKEFRNLERMREAGISVPKPVKCVDNIVVMEYVGTAEKPSKHLKDIEISDPEPLFETIIGQMEKMYRDVGLVHADLSEYNILMTDGGPVIIDVGQAVLKDHPMANEFLARDVQNIVRFFNKHGIEAEQESILARIKFMPDEESETDGGD